MRLFKNLLLGVLVLSILIFLISLLFPSTVTVTRDITINANSSSIRQQLSDPVNWKNWYPQLQEDVGGVKYSSGGFVSSHGTIEWRSTGGKVHGIKIFRPDSLLVEAEFSYDGHTTMQARYSFAAEQGGKLTRLQWKSLLPLGWKPWEKFSGIFAEEMIAPQMQASLNKLKEFVESKQDTLGN